MSEQIRQIFKGIAPWARRRGVAVWGMLVLSIALAGGSSGPAEAQSNPFRPAILVNNLVITQWELDQRAQLLELFRAPGNPQEEARRVLIEERLQLGAAQALGITAPFEAVDAGMAEFAARVNLEPEAFVEQIGAAGVSEQTFRDFVQAGVTWREVIRVRFGPRAQVTEAEVERALALTSRRGGAQALLSEIILPARTPQEAEQAQGIAEEIVQNVSSQAAFAEAARRFSAAPTRTAGGRVPNPVSLGELPPPLRAQILTLAPGDLSEPIQLAGAVAIFQLRDLRETGLSEAENISLEYARYLIPGGGTEAALQEAARVQGRVDTCNDLYGVNIGQPEERLVFETRAVGDIPQALAVELAKLDEGETVTFARGGTQVVLMLCGRTEIRDEEIDRAQVRGRLIEQRLAAYADGYLAELRADAIIRDP